jgi:putative ABC transporter-associated repeat protein
VTATTSRRPRPQRTGTVQRLVGVSTALAAAVVLLTAAGPLTGAAADTVPPSGDPLAQTIAPDQPLVTGQATLTSGHVDIGPRFVDGAWTLLIHDDAARAATGGASVWRQPADTVLTVPDAAQLPVPDDPSYAFLGQAAGTPVYVVPQTQAADVVWIGWNTQDPTVMSTIDRGVTLGMANVEGPGDVIIYLQSGNFGEPTQLWDSRNPDLKPIWVDVNTHTHANWIFTEPGVYLVDFTVSADLLDGSSVTDTQTLRFAVGEGTDPAAALASESSAGPQRGGSEDAQVAAASSSASGDDSTLVALLVGAIILVAVLLVAGVIVLVVRGAATRRRAMAGDR